MNTKFHIEGKEELEQAFKKLGLYGLTCLMAEICQERADIETPTPELKAAWLTAAAHYQRTAETLKRVGP